jgi:ribosomal protein L1
MNEETFNLSIRKFLKTVGVKSQYEIEQAVSKARAQGIISGNETLPVSMNLRIGRLKLDVKFDGEINLE